MLTKAQADAIRMHVALDEPIRRLINLATADLYSDPIYVEADEDDHDAWPGFAAACRLIADAMPRADLYLDVEIDEVIGDTEPHWHHPECGCTEESDVVGYYPDNVLHVDQRVVVRALVGVALAEYV